MKSHLAWKGVSTVIAVLMASFLTAIGLAATSTAESVRIIDTHAHMIRGLRRGIPAATVGQALRVMDDYQVEMTILLPPPFTPGHPGTYGRREIAPVVREHSRRFAFVAGGESLNPMIQSVAPEKVTPKIIREFQKEAEAIVKAGAAGFGEFAAEHFSSGRGHHPYESAPADHPLFLALSDIAAKDGMPIDLHMEAVPQDMPFPRGRTQGVNPESLKENISGFERLLSHNRGARIIWAHAGWDLTGERTVPLMRSLLEKHPNLYMSVKIDAHGSQPTSPFGMNGEIKPDWLALLRAFPERFMVGSDQFFDEGTERLAQVRNFIDALPPEIVHLVARENAKRVYHLDAQGK
jgi:predicted TIM-barrel fold metal-dependent hydrolase